MTYQYPYRTPEGFSDMRMSSDGEALTGLWFDGSRDCLKHEHGECCEEKLLPVFEDTIRWLDLYFQGADPGFTPAYRIRNLTPFRQEVIDRMLAVPFGETVTYGEIAADLAKAHGIPKMSARAVGGAVGWNPVCLIIPCHRVIGTGGSLTGYGGGIGNKTALLKLEGHDISEFTVPVKGTAL